MRATSATGPEGGSSENGRKACESSAPGSIGATLTRGCAVRARGGRQHVDADFALLTSGCVGHLASLPVGAFKWAVMATRPERATLLEEA